jgi:hypothetical protein
MESPSKLRTRARPGLPNPNATKQRLLELAATYFCFRTRDAAALLRGQEPAPSDERSIRRTLSLLHRDGLLARLPHFAYGRERGGAAHVYGLTGKGVSHAFQNGYATPSTKPFDEHSVRTLDHELEITAFHIVLQKLVEQKGLRCLWRQTDLKHTVHPDAIFTISDPARPERGDNYFLEVERAKFGNYRNGEPQIMRKLGTFYNYFNSTGCEREWGFRQYRVVIIQRTDARREGLIAALKRKYQHRMFWLTTEALVREDAGGNIFKTPRDNTTKAYSFLSWITPSE